MEEKVFENSVYERQIEPFKKNPQINTILFTLAIKCSGLKHVILLKS